MPRTSSQAAVLAIILISYFVTLLDNSVIFTGLPSIRADLELSPAALSWVQDAYVLVFGGSRGVLAVPGTTGTASRREGRRAWSP